MAVYRKYNTMVNNLIWNVVQDTYATTINDLRSVGRRRTRLRTTALR